MLKVLPVFLVVFDCTPLRAGQCQNTMDQVGPHWTAFDNVKACLTPTHWGVAYVMLQTFQEDPDHRYSSRWKVPLDR
jgi:hypothetical protein